MKRLTKRTYTISEPHVEMVTAVTGVNVTNILDRLAAYEDAEEQGLLIRLPCKVGDTVFRIWNGEIEQCQVVSVWFNDHIKRRFHAECFPFYRFYDEDIGKRVFLSREQAEAALAKKKAEA